MKRIRLLVLIFGLICIYLMVNIITNRTGTGFVLGNSSYILTNYHLVEGSRKITVRFYNENKISASVIVFDDVSNLAILELKERPFLDAPEFKLGDLNKINTGDSIFSLEFPLINTLGDDPVYQQGTYESAVGPAGRDDWFPVNLSLQKGNSGAPIFNDSGELIGVGQSTKDPNNRYLQDKMVQGHQGIAIPSRLIKKLLDKMPRNASAKIFSKGANPRKELTGDVKSLNKSIVLIEAESLVP